jgi:hypothetical protein
VLSCAVKTRADRVLVRARADGACADGAFGGSGEDQLRLSYIDSEGDRCAIGWDQELTEAQRDAEEDGRLLKIIVEVGAAAVQGVRRRLAVDGDDAAAGTGGTGDSAGDSGGADIADAVGDEDTPGAADSAETTADDKMLHPSAATTFWLRTAVAIAVGICIVPLLAVVASRHADYAWTNSITALASTARMAAVPPPWPPPPAARVPAAVPVAPPPPAPQPAPQRAATAPPAPLTDADMPPPRIGQAEVDQLLAQVKRQVDQGEKVQLDAAATYREVYSRPAGPEVAAAAAEPAALGQQARTDDNVATAVDDTEEDLAEQHRAQRQVAEAIANQVQPKQVEQVQQVQIEEPEPAAPSVEEQARRIRARGMVQQALRDGSGAEVAQLDDQQDAAAFAEYLRRGNTGAMVLVVLVPVFSGVNSVTINAGVDVRLTAELPDTRWNGTFTIDNGGALALHQLRFQDHFAERQGSVASNNGTLVVAKCAFLSSVSLGVGGALVNRESGVMVISDSHFQMNQAMFGGAVFNFNGDLYIEASVFRDNHAETAGGAVALGPHALLSIVDCDFVANAAGLDGDTGEQLGAAIIWSMHSNANCANGTSACWGNDLSVTL